VSCANVFVKYSNNSSLATKPCARASITFLQEKFLVGDYIENAGTVVLRSGLALLRIALLKGKEGSSARREGVFGVEVSSSQKDHQAFIH